jgi:hypothetical protein
MAGFRPVVRARGFWSQAGWRDHRACSSTAEDESASKKTKHGSFDGALGLARTREAFGVRKDEDTWSKPKRTGTAVRETPLR